MERKAIRNSWLIRHNENALLKIVDTGIWLQRTEIVVPDTLRSKIQETAFLTIAFNLDI